MALTEGQIIVIGGTVYHVHLSPNGHSMTTDGQRYDMIPGFASVDPSQMPPAPGNPPIQHGPIQTPPPVPGGSQTPGKGVTVVNTAAMKTFAENLRVLVADNSPLKQIQGHLGEINVRAGGFRTAVNLANKINGPGQLRDGTKKTVDDVVEVLIQISDALLLMASHYEKAEDANTMSSADYLTYLSTASGVINGMGAGGPAA